MKTNKIIFAVSLVALAFLAFSLSTTTVPMQTGASSGIAYHSVVCVYKNGVLVEPCHSNLLTNGGKDLVMFGLNSSGPQNVVLIGVSNQTSAQAATDTALATEWTSCGLTNSSGTFVYRGVGQWNVTKTFTSTCDSVTVNGTALYNNSLGNGLANKMFAETTFTSTTLNTNDQLNITWGIYVS